MRTDATLAALSLLGILALVALAAWTEPDVVSFREAARQEGARVAIEGRILALHDGARARHLTLTDGDARLSAFGPLSPALSTGDTVRLVGVVSRLDDGLGVSAERIELVLAHGARLLAPADLAARPLAYEGARVAVVGELREDGLAGGGARVGLAGEPAPANEGRWIASGVFRYHESQARYVVQVEAWTRPS